MRISTTYLLSWHRLLIAATIVAQGKCIGDTFLSELVKIGLYNFVLSYDQHTVIQEMQACINGVEFDSVKHFIIEDSTTKKSIFTRKIAPKHREIITIGIGGICARIGTTTQAIRLIHSLINNGHKACYVEQNNNKHVAIIKDVFIGSEQEFTGFVTYSDIPLYSQVTAELDNLYDYIVYDYGVLNDDKLDPFSNCDIKVLVAGSTAWEMCDLRAFLNYENVNFLFSFTGKNEQEDILDFMENNWTSTYFAEYSPHMFSELTDVEKQMYNKLVLNRRK
ncbi:MAG: hypothetical protein WAX04_10935 [Oscillospiraceae bacterium]